MKRDVMSVRLWLWRIEVLGVIADAPGELVVRVASAVRRPWCPDCGTPSGKVGDRGDNEVRDLEVSGRPVTLIWERRRLVCEPCGSRFVEGHQAFEGRVTARAARRLVKDARAMTVNAAARRRQVGWKLVNALVVPWAGLVGEHRRRQKCRVLGAQQRPHRPNRQPAPSPATQSPRLRQLRQLRSQRPPPNMNPAEPSSPNPQKDEGSSFTSEMPP